MNVSLRYALPVDRRAVFVNAHAVLTFRMNLDQQLVTVSACQMLEADRMTQRLRQWSHAARIGCAFAQRFPRAWQVSRRSTRIDHRLCAREDEFFERVGKGVPLVALSNYWLGDHARPDAFITSLRAAYEWHEPALFEGTPLALLVLEFLAVPGGPFADRIQAHLEPVFPWALPDVPIDADLDCRRLRTHCKAMRDSRWLGLADALAVIAQQTGNRFLEAPMDNELPIGAMARDLAISARGVRHLEREWREAQRLLRQLDRCVDWLTAEPAQWPDVYELVLASLVTPREQVEEEGED